MWFRHNEEKPPELRASERAVARATDLAANTSEEIEEARGLYAAIRRMRLENHLAERLNAAVRGEVL